MASPADSTSLRNSSDPASPPFAEAGGRGNGSTALDPEQAQPGTGELLEQLRQDRLWLLRQLDSGRWPQWRLDLAALERELGHLLEQAAERLPRS
jgi:hypothetical protein